MSFSDFIYDNYEVLGTAKTEEVRIHCPFCGDDKFHGYVNTTKNVFYCQHCGASPDANSRGYTALMFMVRVHGLTFREAKLIVYGGTAIERIHALAKNQDLDKVIRDLTHVPVTKYHSSALETIEMPDSRPVSKDYVGVGGKLAWQFMFSRFGGRARRLCRQNNIRYCVAGDFGGRIILPVYLSDNLVYFQARSFWPTDLIPRYKNPRDVTAPLFFVNPPPHPNSDLILCEGYFDALALGDYAVAALGSNLTDSQFNELIKILPRRVTVCFDDDMAGHKGALKTCRRLRPYVDDVRVVLHMGKQDPCSLGTKARQTVGQHTVPFDGSAEVLLEMFDA